MVRHFVHDFKIYKENFKMYQIKSSDPVFSDFIWWYKFIAVTIGYDFSEGYSLNLCWLFNLHILNIKCKSNWDKRKQKFHPPPMWNVCDSGTDVW